MTQAQELAISHDFRGQLLPEAQRSVVRLSRSALELCIEVVAPYFADPAPTAPVGPTDRLWEHEVCEVFIADAAEHYLEVELSPHGHHLVLELKGVRQVVRSRLPIQYEARIDLAQRDAAAGTAGRFLGEARVPWDYLPASALRVNAYAIHGLAAQRCYHAHSAPGGDVADFHRLGSFVPFQLACCAG
jgi:hypothetical protein